MSRPIQSQLMQFVPINSIGSAKKGSFSTGADNNTTMGTTTAAFYQKDFKFNNPASQHTTLGNQDDI